MHASIAVIIAAAGVAVAAPHYGGYGEYESVITVTSEVVATSTICKTNIS
jgi:hypothetical protein